jgi:hypothetical protein
MFILLTHLSYSLDKVPSQVFFFFFFFLQWAKMAHHSEKWNMEAPQNGRFYFQVQSSSPLAHLYRWKEVNICKSIRGKSDVLLGTLALTCQKQGQKKNRSLHGKSTVQCPSRKKWTVHTQSTHSPHQRQLETKTSPNPQGKKGGPFTLSFFFLLI